MYGERWNNSNDKVMPSTSRERDTMFSTSNDSARRRVFGTRGRGFALLSQNLDVPDETECRQGRGAWDRKSYTCKKYYSSEESDSPPNSNTPNKPDNSQRYSNSDKSNAPAKRNSEEFNASKTLNYEAEAEDYAADTCGYAAEACGYAAEACGDAAEARGYTPPDDEAERYEDSPDDPFTEEKMGVRRKQIRNPEVNSGRSNNGDKKGKGKSYQSPSDQQNSHHNPRDRQQQKQQRPPRQEYIPNHDPETEEDLFSGGIASGINFDNYDNIEVNVSGDRVPPNIESFREAQLSTIIMNNIRRCSYVKPTPIQKHALPVIMSGRDMMACAQTGSGKTAAFLVPTINCILRRGDIPPVVVTTATPQLLVVTPTRELATQIYLEAKKLAHGSTLKIGICYGGTAHFHQMQKIRCGCHILIATPGRLIDFLTRNAISFVNLHHLIIDEADRMLDMNFLNDIEAIIKHETINSANPPQILLFSATFPEEVQRLARMYLRDYVFVAVGIIGAACSDVEQRFFLVPKYNKKEKLTEVLRQLRRFRTLVFVEKKRTADIIAVYLSEKGFPAVSMHGDREQHLREEALIQFRAGKMDVLVATAVASRGLDIRDIGYVINFDLPRTIDEYVHRIGRTGRVGNRGLSLSFYDPETDSSLAPCLARILVQAHQDIPPFLEEAIEGYDSAVSPPRHQPRNHERRERNMRDCARPPSSDEEW